MNIFIYNFININTILLSIFPILHIFHRVLAVKVAINFVIIHFNFIVANLYSYFNLELVIQEDYLIQFKLAYLKNRFNQHYFINYLNSVIKQEQLFKEKSISLIMQKMLVAFTANYFIFINSGYLNINFFKFMDLIIILANLVSLEPAIYLAFKNFYFCYLQKMGGKVLVIVNK